MNIQFDPIDEVLAALRRGELVIVTDDANRENEGDLILVAEMATPERISFMIRYTSGVICVPMEGVDLDRLDLPLMTMKNTESMRTAYTISVDAVGTPPGFQPRIAGDPPASDSIISRRRFCSTGARIPFALS
jgi:3,4-dihydroxy-2-butanone 4-phosphate synthase